MEGQFYIRKTNLYKMEAKNILLFLLCLAIATYLLVRTFYAIIRNALTKNYFILLLICSILILIFSVLYLLINQFSEPKIYLITQLFAAFGTVSVIILSLWGEKIKEIINPPKFCIIKLDEDGDVAGVGKNINGEEMYEIYFHLIVRNINPPFTLNGCTIVLKEVRLLDPANKEQLAVKRLAAPYCFKWALTYQDDRDHNKYKNIAHEGMFDFIRVNYQKRKIFPVMVDHFTNFEQFFSYEKYILECTMEIQGDNYVSEKSQCFQVMFDGEWTDGLGEIAPRVHISMV